MANQRLTRMVSERALPDIKVLADLDPGLMSAIATALIDAKPSLESRQLAKAVSDSIGREASEVAPAIQIIRRLALAQHAFEMNAESFVDDLAVCLAGLPDTKWSAEYREKWHLVAPELMRALSPNSAIYLSAKAYDLLGEQPLALCSARIITDMRPVFNDEATEMEALLPFHTLVLRCHEGDQGKHREIYIAIDASDLNNIRKQIERAERKEQLLRDKLISDGYTIFKIPTSSEQSEEE